MGNRSKLVAVTASAVGVSAMLARRRARLRHATEGIREAILPTHVMDLPTEARQEGDEAHAPGHRHLPADRPGPAAPRPLRGRPWTEQAHGMRHR